MLVKFSTRTRGSTYVHFYNSAHVAYMCVERIKPLFVKQALIITVLIGTDFKEFGLQ